MSQPSIKQFVTVGDSKRRKMDSGGNQTENGDATAAAAAADAAASGGGLEFIEKKGDLFSCGDSESLAHCISADIAMGKGIAVIFKKKFGGVHELKNQGQKPGGMAFLRRGNRYVYYLITKERYFHKPTYDTLASSLRAMRTHCVQHDVKYVSMPRIGCGLDGLQWAKVSNLIRNVFKDTDMVITVFTL